MKVVFDVATDDIVEFAQVLLKNRIAHQIVDAKESDDDDDDDDDDGFVSIQVEVKGKSKSSKDLLDELEELSKDGGDSDDYEGDDD